jgi:kynurenine formamidase
MCVPGCHEVVMKRLSRRSLFKGAGGIAAAAAMTALPIARARAQSLSVSQIKDLTHPLAPDFPTYFGQPGLEIESVYKFERDGFNLNKWHLNEHTGTHMDAPLHFSKDGPGASEIAVEQLVVPLVIIDIAAKADADADYQLSPDDIKAWEAANGEIPENACVAMHSGWEKHLAGDKFRNADKDSVMHFPGIHVEAADMMMKDRKVAGIAVDTLSLDHGASKTFDTHYKWLPSGRWGMECVANLSGLPAKGATLVVGAPKIVGATGGPCRLIALV